MTYHLSVFTAMPGSVLRIYALAGTSGILARTTEGSVFQTLDLAEAEAALAYLNQPTEGPAKRQGSHRLKSMFGVA